MGFFLRAADVAECSTQDLAAAPASGDPPRIVAARQATAILRKRGFKTPLWSSLPPIHCIRPADAENDRDGSVLQPCMCSRKSGFA